MEEKVYLGAQHGTFENDRGRRIPFASVFFMEPFPENTNPDYHTTGLKASKYKLANPKLVEGLEPLDGVEVYFSSKGAVTKIVKTGENAADVVREVA